MDLMSIIGWLLGIGTLVFGIVFDKDKGIVLDAFQNFVDVPSIAVVLGGVIAGLMVSFPMKLCSPPPSTTPWTILPRLWI